MSRSCCDDSSVSIDPSAGRPQEAGRRTRSALMDRGWMRWLDVELAVLADGDVPPSRVQALSHFVSLAQCGDAALRKTRASRTSDRRS